MTFALLFSVLIFLPQDCQSKPNEKITSGNAIKESRLAGSWYPGSKSSLNDMIEKFIEQVDTPEAIRSPFGFIVPHAGYVYSGKTAAFAYKNFTLGLRGRKIKRIFILAPTHYGSFRGFSTPDYTHYETPLGKVEIDGEILKRLRKHKLHNVAPQAHSNEHAIEIQLPFLQYSLTGFKVVPVLIGQLMDGDYDDLALVFREYLEDGGAVFIVSSDFTHCGPKFGYMPFKFKKPPTKKEYSDALRELDFGAIEKIENLDFKGFRKYSADTKVTICGRNPIALFLRILDGVNEIKTKLLNYSTSMDVSEDYNDTVSYASLMFYSNGNSKKDIKGAKKKMNKNEEYNLTKDEKEILLKISRDTLELYLTKGKYPDKNKYRLSDNLRAKRGVFVTLHKKGALRGCIGYIEGILPVYQAVMENTVNAALEDPRFPNVTASETGDLDIEISVMTPLSIFKKPEEIEIGRDGLVISKGRQKGLLLPQVATEWKWGRTQFLEAVSNKAGLPRGAWKDADVKLEKFSAIVFGEKK